jgi:hypothetical protein
MDTYITQMIYINHSMKLPLTRSESIELTTIITHRCLSFMSVIESTCGRLHSEFVWLLFLQTHRETDHFLAVSGVQLRETNRCRTPSSSVTWKEQKEKNILSHPSLKPDPTVRQRMEVDMFQPIRVDHTDFFQVAIKTLQFKSQTPLLNPRWHWVVGGWDSSLYLTTTPN